MKFALIGTVIKDTIFTDREFSFSPLFTNPKGITFKNGTIYYITYEDNNREIFSVFGKKDSFQVYLMTTDGSIKYLKGKIQNRTPSSFKFVKKEQSLQNEYGVAFGDIDNDNDDDIYIISTAERNRVKLYGGNSKIKSRYPHNFVDAADRLNLLATTRAEDASFVYDMGVTLADMDNDGDLDLFLVNRGRNLFFKNTGNKKFVRTNEMFQINREEHSTGIACGDPDNDGDIDWLCGK